MIFLQVEQKTLSTLRSFLHRKHSTSGASATVSSADHAADHADDTPTGEMGKPGTDLPSAHKMETLPQAAVTQPMFHAQASGAMGKPGMDLPSVLKMETLPQTMSFAQTRMHPFLKRQWSEDLSVRGVSHQPHQIELSSPSTVHANKVPFIAMKIDLTKRKVPVLRRSISSSQVALIHTALAHTAPTPTALTPTLPDGRESGPVDMRTHTRDGRTKSEGNSPLEGSNKPPIGCTRVATTATGGVAMEISSPDEDAGAERRKNESFTQKSFQSGKF